jgi:hypothetical protein
MGFKTAEAYGRYTLSGGGPLDREITSRIGGDPCRFHKSFLTPTHGLE